MLGFRSLKYPALPDRQAPDYHAQLARYWRESATWWDNWAWNGVLSLMLVLASTLAAVLVIAGLAIWRLPSPHG